MEKLPVDSATKRYFDDVEDALVKLGQIEYPYKNPQIVREAIAHLEHVTGTLLFTLLEAMEHEYTLVTDDESWKNLNDAQGMRYFLDRITKSIELDK